jgi:cytochrome c oxidase subunit II
MTTSAAGTPAGNGVNHGKRIVVAWIVLSVVATPLVAAFLGPALPPGNGSAQATEQVFDNTWLTTTVTPIICLLLVFFVYALAKFRHSGGELVDGPPLRNDSRIQVLWIAISGLTAVMLASFGTYELLQTGSGGGQGPKALVTPSGPKMEVQVIAQQWQFTYRYPAYGGVETPKLMLPADTLVEFHVTSLDAIHSFWAYQLGVKADANPGVDNIAFVKTKGPISFEVRCAELCGLWHGYMFNSGHVVPQAQFASWIKSQQAAYAPVAKYLPKYSTTYLPDPQRRAG